MVRLVRIIQACYRTTAGPISTTVKPVCKMRALVWTSNWIEYGMKLSDTIEGCLLALQDTRLAGECWKLSRCFVLVQPMGRSTWCAFHWKESGCTRGRSLLHSLRWACNESSWNTADALKKITTNCRFQSNIWVLYATYGRAIFVPCILYMAWILIQCLRN